MSGILDGLGGRLLGGFSRSRPRPRADGLVYAVGDIHGCTDLLEPLIEKILSDALREQETMPDGPPPAVVFLGDMVDRGPDSRGTLEFISAIRDWPEISPVLLLGNHEVMLLEFLSDPVKNHRWLRFGGYETLVSYGLGKIGDIGSAAELRHIAEDLGAAMGPHVDLLKSCVYWHLDGNIAFVHAGADPDVGLALQTPETLTWGSDKFGRKQRGDGLWIVYGHTIVERPSARRGRIALDTGAYATGVLTAMKAKNDEIRFFSESRSGDDGASQA